jgi:hypothetical protein
VEAVRKATAAELESSVKKNHPEWLVDLYNVMPQEGRGRLQASARRKPARSLHPPRPMPEL